MPLWKWTLIKSSPAAPFRALGVGASGTCKRQGHQCHQQRFPCVALEQPLRLAPAWRRDRVQIRNEHLRGDRQRRRARPQAASVGTLSGGAYAGLEVDPYYGVAPRLDRGTTFRVRRTFLLGVDLEPRSGNSPLEFDSGSELESRLGLDARPCQLPGSQHPIWRPGVFLEGP